MFHSYKDSEFDSLEQELAKLSKPQISDVEKRAVRDQLMLRVERRDQTEYLPLSLRKLARVIQRKGHEVSIPAWASALLKERILDYVELSRSWREEQRFEQGWGTLRTGIATLLLFVFATSAVLIVPFKAPTAFARTTYLDDVSGDVKVLRNSSVFKGETMMPLKEGDKVMTEEGGAVTIHFFDDSLSRLAEKTSVQVKRLYAEPLRSAVTHVEVELEGGRMWTRVVNITNDSDFMVSTPSARAGVQKKAAFDLQANDEVTEVSVYDNVVEVASKKDADASKTVIAGYKVAISDESMESTVLQKIEDTEEVWVALNLTSDETYKMQLIEGTEELVELQGEENMLLASTLSVSDEQLKKARKQIDDAYKTLVNAEAQLVRGARQEGIKGLQEYKMQVAVIIASLPMLEEKDPLYAQLLRDLLQEKVDVQLKDFASFRPGDRLYRAKEILQETELALASSDVNKVEVQLAQAEDALLEMQQLMEDGEPGLAATLLKRYQNRTNTFSLELSEKNENELSEKFISLIEKQANHMKVLTAIEQSIAYRDQYVFRDEVRRVRDDTLRKFLIALEQNPDQISSDVLLEVKDLYDSYVLEGDSSAEDLLNPAVDKLLTKEYQVLFVSPNNQATANGTGVLVLVSTQEATGDVGEGDWLCTSTCR